ncbi:hypothetical protein [Allofournierella sp.]
MSEKNVHPPVGRAKEEFKQQVPPPNYRHPTPPPKPAPEPPKK